MGDNKSFLHDWCNKSGKEPQFEIRPTGNDAIEIQILFEHRKQNLLANNSYLMQ